MALSLMISTGCSPEVSTWLQQCPDAQEVGVMLHAYQKAMSLTQCFECENETSWQNLRPNLASPMGSDPDHFICRECWEIWKGGTMGNPDYRPPSWEDQKISLDMFLPSVDDDKIPVGVITDSATGMRVGDVKNYSKIGHFGFVTLDDFPDSGELGSLDPNHIVTATAK
jgi:hypothetical protein